MHHFRSPRTYKVPQHSFVRPFPSGRKLLLSGEEGNTEQSGNLFLPSITYIHPTVMHWKHNKRQPISPDRGCCSSTMCTYTYVEIVSVTTERAFLPSSFMRATRNIGRDSSIGGKRDSILTRSRPRFAPPSAVALAERGLAERPLSRSFWIPFFDGPRRTHL